MRSRVTGSRGRRSVALGAAGAGAANAMGTNRVIAAAANERMLNERICVMKGKKLKE